MMQATEKPAATKAISHHRWPIIRKAILLLEVAVLIGLPLMVLPWRFKLRERLCASGETHPLQLVPTTDPPIKLIGHELEIMYFVWALPLLLLLHVDFGWKRKRPIGRSAYLILAWGLVVSSFWLLLRVKSNPVYRDIIRETPPNILPKPFIPISILFHIAFPIVFWVVPFVFALFCAGRGSKYKFVKFSAGFLAAELFMMSVAQVRPPWHTWPVADSILLLVVASAPILLPKTRRRIERLLGFAVGSADVLEPANPSWLSRALGRFSLGTLAFTVPVLGVFGLYVRKFNYVYDHGPGPIHHSPALKNVFDDWKVLFSEEHSLDHPFTESENDDWFFILEENTPPDLFDRAVDELDLTDDLEKFFASAEPYMRSLESARSADYLEVGEDNLRGWNIRLAIRALNLRAMLRIHQGRPDEAIHDIETLYYAGNIMKGGPYGVFVLGIATKLFACRIVYHYYLTFRQDPARLDMLEDALKRLSPLARQSVDIESLRRTDPQLWPVMLSFETSFMRFEYHYSAFAEHDLLLTALALERYRRDRGAYPDTLEAIAPEYIERIPVDPWDGAPFHYKNLQSEFELETSTLKTILTRYPERVTYIPIFPPSRMDNTELREKLAMRSAMGDGGQSQSSER